MWICVIGKLSLCVLVSSVWVVLSIVVWLGWFVLKLM